MYGAMICDIAGSKYEFHNIKTKNFPLFSEGCDYTDDTIVTVAVAKAILLSREARFKNSGVRFQKILVETMQDFGRRYPNPTGAYGGNFAEFETASGKTTLFLYSRREFAKALGQEYCPPWGINFSFEIALWLPEYTDVDSEYRRLSQLGVQFPCGGPVFDFGIRNFYVADPEGNLLEIGSTNAAEG